MTSKKQLTLTFERGSPDALKQHLRAYLHGFWENSVFRREAPEDTKPFFKTRFVHYMRAYYNSGFDMAEKELESMIAEVVAEWRKP
jgi:hypothetical protein